jgi:membrane peptidoglycan carboxypeptidase
MPYRPRKRHAYPVPSVGGAGNGNHHRRSPAARLVIARSTSRGPASRRPASRGLSAIVAAILVVVIGVATVVSAAAIAAGGAAAVTIATLDQDLPDVRAFRDIDFSQPTRIYDRRGKVELARVWNERREVIDFDDVPALVLDATTATEDDTFWENPGIDLEATVNALLSAATGGASRGGASTITQQLVRARLLPEEITSNDDTTEGLYLRKAKELLQAFKLTQAFPGEEGKKAIITAYLNQASYGAAEGIAAAAELYLHKDLDELTLSEAALLAAIPQEPSSLYPWATNPKTGRYTNIVKETRRAGKHGKRRSHYYIRDCRPADTKCVPTELVARRDYILGRLRDGKGRWTQVSDRQYEAALDEKIEIHLSQPFVYKAPHFVARLLESRELSQALADRASIREGGYRITTTLDYRAQQLGEKFVQAGAWVPNMPSSRYYQAIRQRKLGRDASWISRLRGLNLYNGALVALDYRTGDILAYVGSAGYYRKQIPLKSKTPRFDPRFDHAGLGHRQMGSAWKPIVYATGIDTGALTAGTVLLDITTPFGPDWAPRDADSLDRGPVLVREALQYSLNIPAIRALHRTGVKTVRKYAVRAGFDFLPEPLGFGRKALDVAGLAGAIGTVEVSPIDMVSAFGAFGNGGKVTRPRYILKVEDADGHVIYEAGEPATTQVWSPQTAYIMADILKGNANPAVNGVWGPIFELRNTRDGRLREMAVKTGTTNDLKDYSTYGFLPIPRDRKQPALAVGVWFGNSDSSSPNLSRQVFSMDTAGRAWHAFVRDYTNRWPASRFRRPPRGVVAATIDTFTGGAPGAWTRGTRTELFVQGTQPGGRHQVDPPGLLYSKACGYGVIQPARAENKGAPASWRAAVDSWAARGGLGRSRWGSRGSYFTMAGKSSFGGRPAAGDSCAGDATRTTSPNGPSGGGGGNDRGGGGGVGPAPTCRPGTTNKPPDCVIPVG